MTPMPHVRRVGADARADASDARATTALTGAVALVPDSRPGIDGDRRPGARVARESTQPKEDDMTQPTASQVPAAAPRALA